MLDCGNKFFVDLPYPTPVIKRANAGYAKILLEDYCGETVAELPAILQYLYGHFVSGNYPEIQEALKCIAIVEMHHMDMLAAVISNLGIDPRYRTISPKGQDKYWTSDKLNYSKDVNSILLENIESERLAIAQYRDHISIINDAEINALLSRIISDEQLHIERLTALFEEHNAL